MGCVLLPQPGRSVESEDVLSWVVILALEVFKLLPRARHRFACLPLPLDRVTALQLLWWRPTDCLPLLWFHTVFPRAMAATFRD